MNLFDILRADPRTLEYVPGFFDIMDEINLFGSIGHNISGTERMVNYDKYLLCYDTWGHTYRDNGIIDHDGSIKQIPSGKVLRPVELRTSSDFIHSYIKCVCCNETIYETKEFPFYAQLETIDDRLYLTDKKLYNKIKFWLDKAIDYYDVVQIMKDHYNTTRLCKGLEENE